MTLLNDTDLQSFVLLRLGDRRFAVAATQIAELVPPSRVFRFPHHTGEVEGVILRQVVLLGREGITRHEARAERHRGSGRRQRKRQDRNRSCPHEVETWSTGEKPTT